MEGGDSCKTMGVYLMPMNCTLKNSQNDRFLLGAFYHNFKKWASEEFPTNEPQLSN